MAKVWGRFIGWSYGRAVFLLCRKATRLILNQAEVYAIRHVHLLGKDRLRFAV